MIIDTERKTHGSVLRWLREGRQIYVATTWVFRSSLVPLVAFFEDLGSVSCAWRVVDEEGFYIKNCWT